MEYILPKVGDVVIINGDVGIITENNVGCAYSVMTKKGTVNAERKELCVLRDVNKLKAAIKQLINEENP